MHPKTLPRRRPLPTIATGAFVVALAVTVAYYAGLVPGIPKTLPTFVDLLMVTGSLLVVAALLWGVSFALE
jgi:hypothetical protein